MIDEHTSDLRWLFPLLLENVIHMCNDNLESLNRCGSGN